MNRRECLNCTYWVAGKPDDPLSPDENAAWGLYYLRAYLIRNKLVISAAGWKGSCRRDPVPVEARSVHYCGSWTCNADNIWLNLATSGSFTREAELAGLVESLRAELKVERERSLERYRKLKVAKAQPRTNGTAARPQQEPLNGQP